MALVAADRLIPTCPATGRTCPVEPCPGATDPGVCDHWGRLAAWRAVPVAEQADRAGGAARSAIDPRVRDAVLGCADRGPVLPVAEQDDCGCRGRELSSCRAGRGVRPGRVTLRDCLDCQATRLGLASFSAPGGAT